MKNSKYVLMPAALCGALLLAACGDSSSTTPQSNNPNSKPPATQPGLAERTGRALDNAADKTGDAMKSAGNKISDTSKDLANRAGNATDNAADKTRDASRDLANRADNATDRAGDNARRTGNDIANNTADTANRTADAVRPVPDTGVTAAPGVMNNQSAATPTTQPGGATANLPGLPSVTGTDTSNLKTADAAAQRLLDKAQVEGQKGDRDHVRRLVKELQEMRDSLSPEFQRKVDDLAKANPETPTNNNAAPTANER